ncbi:MAG: sulfatase-like hydrolase/transferase, partial [Planctomycetota bacterium]|nr:sulfatase-like hydrolase/transferase [Planctomycetota bacterium]
MSEQPNILWICSDQQRFDTLGCYGNSFVHTPHIDQLAQEGGYKIVVAHGLETGELYDLHEDPKE